MLGRNTLSMQITGELSQICSCSAHAGLADLRTCNALNTRRRAFPDRSSATISLARVIVHSSCQANTLLFQGIKGVFFRLLPLYATGKPSTPTQCQHTKPRTYIHAIIITTQNHREPRNPPGLKIDSIDNRDSNST